MPRAIFNLAIASIDVVLNDFQKNIVENPATCYLIPDLGIQCLLLRRSLFTAAVTACIS
jgi:hypothetical protein